MAEPAAAPRPAPRPSRGERAGRWISASRAAFWRTATLRLRLKIGDASGHTRTVEFPFNTDTDSSYSVASEMVDALQPRAERHPHHHERD